MHLFRLSACLAFAAAAGAAMPAVAQSTSTTFQVRMSISSVCSFTAPAASDIDFGDQPSTATNIDADGELSVSCTPGTAYQITLDAGQNGGAGGITERNMSNGTNLVPYQLYRDPGRTLVWGVTLDSDTVTGVGSGAAQTIPVYGRVPTANFPTGSYFDVVTAAVIY